MNEEKPARLSWDRLCGLLYDSVALQQFGQFGIGQCFPLRFVVDVKQAYFRFFFGGDDPCAAAFAFSFGGNGHADFAQATNRDYPILRGIYHTDRKLVCPSRCPFHQPLRRPDFQRREELFQGQRTLEPKRSGGVYESNYRGNKGIKRTSKCAKLNNNLLKVSRFHNLSSS